MEHACGILWRKGSVDMQWRYGTTKKKLWINCLSCLFCCADKVMGSCCVEDQPTTGIARSSRAASMSGRRLDNIRFDLVVIRQCKWGKQRNEANYMSSVNVKQLSLGHVCVLFININYALRRHRLLVHIKMGFWVTLLPTLPPIGQAVVFLRLHFRNLNPFHLRPTYWSNTFHCSFLSMKHSSRSREQITLLTEAKWLEDTWPAVFNRYCVNYGTMWHAIFHNC